VLFLLQTDDAREHLAMMERILGTAPYRLVKLTKYVKHGVDWSSVVTTYDQQCNWINYVVRCTYNMFCYLATLCMDISSILIDEENKELLLCRYHILFQNLFNSTKNINVIKLRKICVSRQSMFVSNCFTCNHEISQKTRNSLVITN
jgi:hypothetical protein